MTAEYEKRERMVARVLEVERENQDLLTKLETLAE
jgi:hypothetical protein